MGGFFNTLNKSLLGRSSKALEGRSSKALALEGQFLCCTVTLSVTMYSQLHCVRTFHKCSRVFAVLIISKATAWAMYMGVVLCAQPGHGESHILRNANREVATTSSPSYNELYRSHVLFVKAALGTTFKSWSQQHFVEIGKPKRKVHKVSHCGSKQQ